MRVGGRGRQRDPARNIQQEGNINRHAASKRGSQWSRETVRKREKDRKASQLWQAHRIGAMKPKVQILKDRNAYQQETERGRSEKKVQVKLEGSEKVIEERVSVRWRGRQLSSAGTGTFVSKGTVRQKSMTRTACLCPDTPFSSCSRTAKQNVRKPVSQPD